MDGIEVEDGEVGFEEGMSWLPSHVLDEAIWGTKEYLRHHNYHHRQQYQQRHRSKLLVEPLPLHSKSKPRPNHKAKLDSNWASGGSGMQAFFLDSGRKSCGTGVFLPQRGGTNFQPTKKPACATVLLPYRVVQALNLNVHELGLQISRRQDTKDDAKGDDCHHSVNNKSELEVSEECCVKSVNENSSAPEMFLPKEWTY